MDRKATMVALNGFDFVQS